MQILFKLVSKKSLNKGFTTLEILISIIIALAFVSVTMQSFVLALGMKVQAQEKQRANQMIQEDLERLSDLGSLIRADHANKCNPLKTASKTAYENGYAWALWDEIKEIKEEDLNTQLNNFKSSKTLKLKRNHIYDNSDPSKAKYAPYRTLKIRYRVHDSDDTTITDDEVVAERYVEVIPDVALQCP